MQDLERPRDIEASVGAEEEDRLLHSDHFLDDGRAQDHSRSTITTPIPTTTPGELGDIDSSTSTISTRQESRNGIFSVVTKCRDGQSDMSISYIDVAERFLRYAVMVAGAYMLGAYHGLIDMSQIFLVVGIVSVVWLATLLIKYVTSRSSLGTTIVPRAKDTSTIEESDEENQKVYSMSQTDEIQKSLSISTTADITSPNINVLPKHHESYAITEMNNIADTVRPNADITEPIITVLPQHHPELEDFYVVDKVTDQRVLPNSEPLFIDNELFSGYAVCMVRTSDADKDSKNAVQGSRQNTKVSDHFRSKKRRFEMQLQIKFKKVPESQLYFGTELDEPIGLSFIQRAFVGATMNFVKKRNPGFHYNITGAVNVSDSDMEAGKYEKAHMMFTWESSFDVILVTKPNEIPPQLGGPINEDPKSAKARFAGISKVKYNTEDTYTLAIWSAYVDFVQWKCVNLPAIRPFDLNSVMDNQAFSLSLFVLKSGNENHQQSNIQKYLSYEFGHTRKTKPGRSYSNWLKKCQMAPRSNVSLTGDNDSEFDSSVPTNYAESSIDFEPVDEYADKATTNNGGVISFVGEPKETLHSAVSLENATLDVPAWIEMIHRTNRHSQRAFIIRIAKEATQDIESNILRMRLRTKEELEKLHLGNNVDVQMALNINTKSRRNKSKDSNNEQKKVQHYFLAGELSPLDHSRYTLSKILEHHCSPPSSSDLPLVSMHLGKPSELDLWFLQGSSRELGLVTSKKHEKIIGEGIVARCLWESRWREEVCLIKSACIEFYAPLLRKPFSVSHLDIQLVREVDKDETMNPLPGLKLIAIETVWRCHYLAFLDENTRDLFQSTLDGAILGYKSKNSSHTSNADAWTARIWQDFQPSISGYKWASLSLSKKSKRPKPRIVLNDRQMAFDCESFDQNGVERGQLQVIIATFVEDLLRQALSISLTNLEDSHSDFLVFLNNTSRLRKIPLSLLDMSSKQSCCIFINIYHCLLQHALITSGPPTKKSIGRFMRSHCYEIGDDVFSLSEIESHVIRGNMSLPIQGKPPYVISPPGRSKDHLVYALGVVDPRINFLLNSGDTSKPSHVPIMTTHNFEDNLNHYSKIFLRQHLSVDLSKKVIMLPKICEIYRDDFGGSSPLSICHYCLKFLDKSTLLLIEMCNDHGVPTYKFGGTCDSFHSILSEKPSS